MANEMARDLERVELAGCVADLALEILAALSAPEWEGLTVLARRHTRGEIGPEAWRTCSGAILTQRMAEVEAYGFMHVGLERGGNGKNGA